MHIFWHGLSCVKLQTSNATFLINPYQNSTGLTMPSLKVDVVASTDPNNDQANNVNRMQGDPQLVVNPGEYEMSEIFVYGISAGQGRSLFVIEAEGIKIGHPGTEPMELTDKQLEVFEGVDILLLPVTGDIKTISTLVSKVEPRIIIPIQFADGKNKSKVELNTIDEFAKEFGVKDTDSEKKLIIKTKDLPVDETRIVILNAA